MNPEQIKEQITSQRTFFSSGQTLQISYRIQHLEKLERCIQKHQNDICAALKADLGKPPTESYMCEIGMTLSEISYMKKHLAGFARRKYVCTPISQFPAKSYTLPSPYGVVLVMSPWNYPFLLSLEPMVDALAAGNTVLIKPSAYAPETGKIICKIVQECFSPEYVSVILGGREENQYLLSSRFDYIFFTGSQAVGKEVMQRAANYLTPVTLELGGKSPCIVDQTADIKLAARRIVFGKFLNCGQTCVAPDYLYCHKEIHDELVQELKRQIVKQYSKNPLTNKKYGKIINQKHFDRILGLLDQGCIVHGGNFQRETLQIEPTILDHVSWNDPVMQEEIFGPLLPILTYTNLCEVTETIQKHPHPLALYHFSSDENRIHAVQRNCQFGGGCVNDTIIHLASTALPFGGFGESGMGAYHGKAGFATFSHTKSIVDKKTWLDLPLRYQPYKTIYHKLIKLFLK